MNVFKPSPRYLTRLRVIATLWAVSLLVLGILVAGLVSLDGRHAQQATILLQAFIVADLIWYLPALRLMRSVYENRSYSLDTEEIAIRSGWFTESVRRVPLSSVVAFELRWDRLDRWLEIGTLEVQTVSWPGIGASRFRLAGLADVDVVAQLVSRLLQNLRDQRLADRIFPAGSPENNLLSLRHQSRI